MSLVTNEKNFLFVEKFRPNKVADVILPESLKATFQAFVDKGEIPNMTLVGPAGTGKTTIAKAMLHEIGADYIVINGSMNAGIDTLRNDIMQFASSVSFSGGRKYVILDEADYISGAVQAALRNFMEEYSSNCGFILTANFENRIIEPLHSRAPIIRIKIPSDEKAKIASQLMKRTIAILNEEGIAYTKEAVATLIQRYFPDFRRILNEIQKAAAATGEINETSILGMNDEKVNAVVKFLREKDFTIMRKWVGENSDLDQTSFFRSLYEKVVPMLIPSSGPELVILLGEYQAKSAHVADQEINTAALLTEVMATCTFK
jgi:DNA polymerase III delta prime subunit